MAKRKQQEEVNTGAWMNTYSDLVTLLMTFFVLLFSMSSVDAEKWEYLVKALSNPGDDTAQVVINANDKGDELANAMGDTTPVGETLEMTDKQMPASFNELYEYLKSYAESHEMSDSVEVSKSGENTVNIRFQNNIFFMPDSSTVRAEAHELLDFVGECLNAVESEIMVVMINGHTAAVPNGQYYQVSDWLLSSERAGNIAIYLEEKSGFVPTKLRPIGYGKNYPIADNNTIEGRERNRRVDMVIVSNNNVLANTSDGAALKEFFELFDPSQFPNSGSIDTLTEPNGGEPADDAAALENQDAQSAVSSAPDAQPPAAPQTPDEGAQSAAPDTQTEPPAPEGSDAEG